uniref:Uncharacterized protein n=1 Tax=Arundo donax TaxID=35708 RepID=A0A0A9GNM5_ARUDO
MSSPEYRSGGSMRPAAAVIKLLGARSSARVAPSIHELVKVQARWRRWLSAHELAFERAAVVGCQDQR